MNEDNDFRRAQDLSATSVDYLKLLLPQENEARIIRLAITLVKVSPGNRHETMLRMLEAKLKKLEKAGV